MSLRRTKLAAGLEQFQADIQVEETEGVQPEVIEGGEPAAEEAEEVRVMTLSTEDGDISSEEDDLRAAVADVEYAEEDLAEATEVVEGLEDIAEAMRDSISEGGLDQTSAVGYDLAIEAYCSRIGHRITRPSVESYGGTASRTTTTRIGLESLGEELKKLWAWIVDLCKSVGETIGKMWNMVFDTLTRVENNAKKVLEALPKIDGRDVKPGNNLELKGEFGRLVLAAGGTKSLTKVIENLATDTEAYFVAQYQSATEVTQATVRELAGLDVSSGEKFMEACKSAIGDDFPTKLVEGMLGKGLKSFFNISMTGATVFEAAPIGTGVLMVGLDVPSFKDATEPKERLGRLQKTRFVAGLTHEPETNKAVETPTQEQIETAAKAIIAAVESLRKFKKASVAGEKARKEIEVLTKKFSKSNTGEWDREAVSTLRALGKFLGYMVAMPDYVPKQVIPVVTSALGTANTLLANAVKNY